MVAFGSTKPLTTRLTSLALLVDVVEFMKQMNRQQHTNIHIKKTKLNALIASLFLLATCGSSRRVKTDIFKCIISTMSMALSYVALRLISNVEFYLEKTVVREVYSLVHR